LFLLSRNNFVKVKRLTKCKYYSKEKDNLSRLSKKSPRKFWKYIKSSETRKIIICKMM
jgi:hypothetical protein